MSTEIYEHHSDSDTTPGGIVVTDYSDGDAEIRAPYVKLSPDERRKLARALDPDTYLEHEVWGATLLERVADLDEARREIARLRAAAAEVGPDEGPTEAAPKGGRPSAAAARLLTDVRCPKCSSVDVDNVGDGETALCMSCREYWRPGHDRREPPPGYAVRDLSTEDDDEHFWDAYTIMPDGDGALDGGWGTRDEAVARCWAHRDAVLASAAPSAPQGGPADEERRALVAQEQATRWLANIGNKAAQAAVAQLDADRSAKEKGWPDHE